MARPTKYHSDMLPKILKLMRDGASKTEVAADLGISRDTLHEWTKQYPEFSDTIKRGEQLSQAWWERKGRQNLENKAFSYTGWYMNMKNRFGWRDNQNADAPSGELRLEPVKVMGSAIGLDSKLD